MTRVADRTVELTVMTSEEQNNPKNQKDANDKVDPQMRLDGNEAINLAEKQAKKTADKNIPKTARANHPAPMNPPTYVTGQISTTACWACCP